MQNPRNAKTKKCIEEIQQIRNAKAKKRKS